MLPRPPLQGAACCTFLLCKVQLVAPSYFQGGPSRASVLLKVTACCHRPTREPAAGRGGGRQLQLATDGKPGKGEFQRSPSLLGAAFLAKSRLLLSVAPKGKGGKERFFRSFLLFWSPSADSGGPSLPFSARWRLCRHRFHFCSFRPLNRLLLSEIQKSELLLAFRHFSVRP